MRYLHNLLLYIYIYSEPKTLIHCDEDDEGTTAFVEKTYPPALTYKFKELALQDETVQSTLLNEIIPLLHNHFKGKAVSLEDRNLFAKHYAALMITKVYNVNPQLIRRDAHGNLRTYICE